MDQTTFFTEDSNTPTDDPSRPLLNAEWATVTALRETLGYGRSNGVPTYEQTFEFAKEFAPAMFAKDKSILIGGRENPILRRFSQIAEAESRQSGEKVTTTQL